MTQSPLSDAKLQEAYAELIKRRVAGPPAPDVPVETIHALAEGRYEGSDRAARLEQVLAHPATAAELEFFLDLVSAKPAAPARRIPAWLPIAATLALVVSGTLLVRQLRVAGGDPVRAGGLVEVTRPAEDGGLAPGSTIAWRPVAGAESYRVEVIDGDGSQVFGREVSDTTLTVAETTRIEANLPYQLWVTARLRDGTEIKSATRNVKGAAR